MARVVFTVFTAYTAINKQKDMITKENIKALQLLFDRFDLKVVDAFGLSEIGEHLKEAFKKAPPDYQPEYDRIQEYVKTKFGCNLDIPVIKEIMDKHEVL